MVKSTSCPACRCPHLTGSEFATFAKGKKKGNYCETTGNSFKWDCIHCGWSRTVQYENGKLISDRENIQ